MVAIGTVHIHLQCKWCNLSCTVNTDPPLWSAQKEHIARGLVPQQRLQGRDMSLQFLHNDTST
jgi:hypothetical protein